MMLSLDTAYRSFGGEVEASSTPTICRLSDSRRHQLWAIALSRTSSSIPWWLNSGRAASSFKAAAGGGRRPAFTELAGRPYSGHRIGRLVDADGRPSVAD